jgi:hypothetical protein
MNDRAFDALVSFLAQIPAIEDDFGQGTDEAGLWWVKFRIDVQHPLAWEVVQELGHVLNYLASDERLPTRFYPVSPPPYMNGGPREFLSWVIETNQQEFTPKDLRAWLEGRLPRPVTDEAEWLIDDEA